MNCRNNDIIKVFASREAGGRASSFAVELSLQDCEGNALDPVVAAFRFVYLDSGGRNPYEVEHRPATDTQPEYFKNCYLKDGRLFAKFENYAFRNTRLIVEMYLRKPVVPDAGDGFTGGEMMLIRRCDTNIGITDSVECCHDGKCAGTQNIVFPCVEYTGTTSTQAEIIVNDFIHNKSLISDAINAKGGEADKTDSAAKLADSILNLIPAQPVFATSGNLNPRWTDLQAKIAENFRDDRRHAWAFSFLGNNQAVELTGGDYYICSDGYETDQSEAHTFGANLDENKTDNWVIIYTPTPAGVFPVNVATIGAAFYNTSPELISFYGTRIAFISQLGDIGKLTFSLPTNFARSTGLTYFTVPDGVENATIGSYAFDGCAMLSDMYFPKSIKSITFNSYVGQGIPIIPVINNTLYPDLEQVHINQYAFQTAGLNLLPEIVIESKENINLIGNTSVGHQFASARANVLRLKSKIVQASGSYLITNSGIARMEILAEDSIDLRGYYTFTSNQLKELYIQKPRVSIALGTFPFSQATSLVTIELENGWDKSINLSTANVQSTVSMYRNVQALADRTGQTALTLTLGAAKLASLLAAYPDAASIASSKNWNLA